MKIMYVLCLAACYFVLSSCQLSPDSNDICREPVNVTEMYRTLRIGIIEEAGMSQDESSTTENDQQHHVTITALNNTCRREQYGRICNCPSRHQLNFDPNRIPKILVQTSCCGENENVTASWITRCQEVYNQVRVLRRAGCIDGVFRYTLQWERVPVGCSCRVIPRIFSAP